MSKERIREIVARRTSADGFVETGIEGVQLFRLTTPLHCAPAVYEPCVVAIVSGSKEAIVDSQRYRYDQQKYFCCTLSMPVEAGAPEASPKSPLLGVYLSLNTRVLTELTIAMGSVSDGRRGRQVGSQPPGLALASWDENFSDALLRLLELEGKREETSVLGEGRLRELYYAILKGEAGESLRHAFGVGNEVGRAIHHLSSRLSEVVTIEELAARAGMSRAVFHRKFKQATAMSPIQFVKSMRLNKAAMKIAQGMTVNEAAQEVGYQSSSQFSRDFKKRYGQSPKIWSQSNPGAVGGLVLEK
ncbi:AraC family transcriptional regulator [Roseibacillus persicicus]|uniref:AraC family transcriptional regulator n=1 Tax=Roseibacillus persicicus TaxID=454148 RepID=UPI00280D36A3|nr:AraC family transcriptional regulator [Roseibacillus persicicus]MDQ8190107.1 AraC family transcriptional regulator [Roseibacillus persicicus]